MDLIAKLESQGSSVRSLSENKWEAQCPAHEDRTASLSVERKPDKWLVNCHANCTFHSIADALGLKPGDFFIGDRERPQPTRIEYKYLDEAGNHVYSAIRIQNPDGTKDFRQRQANGDWTMKGVDRVLYNLPAVIQSQTVFVVEGEKDVETLRKHGIVATCNVGGAGKFRQEYARYLEGKTVYILPDNDTAGRKHADDVRDILGHGLIVELPVGEKQDVSDWFSTGGTVDELSAIIERAEQANSPKTLRSVASNFIAELSYESETLLSTGIEQLDVDNGGGIAPGESIVIGARPSHGKSAFGLHLLEEFSKQGIPGLFVSCEMTGRQVGQRIVQRASPLHRDTWPSNKAELAEDLDAHFRSKADVFLVDGFTDLSEIEREIERKREQAGVEAVVIDYVQQVTVKSLGQAKEYDRTTHVASVLNSLRKRLGITLILLAQLNRNLEASQARQRTGKSQDGVQLPRMSDLKATGQLEQDADVVWLCVWPKMLNPEFDPSSYLVVNAKNRNRGYSNGMTSMTFDPKRQIIGSALERASDDFAQWQ